MVLTNRQQIQTKYYNVEETGIQQTKAYNNIEWKWHVYAERTNSD